MSVASFPPPIITLTTDFGLADTYVGVIKGVLLGIAPRAQIVDLTHEIAPQNIAEASLRLEAACSYFPPGTIHLVVVDPGVGSARDAVVVETETYLFVAPDNGVLTCPLRQNPARRVVRLAQAAERYYRHPVSATFHGRDVFAPIAAHLAAGLSLDALDDGPKDAASPQRLVEIALPEPRSERDAQGRPALCLHILYADRFGNLVTDLTPHRWAEWLGEIEPKDPIELAATVLVRVGKRQWQGLARTFADAKEGQPLAYWGSGGHLEIALRNGNAAQTLAISPGESLTLTWEPFS